ncbi:MAG: hypothetical protein BWX79_02016 [Alphaproteobacteria bacterium ADurb.Bin100]|nr:MAG: hypothetical protein BWX79_02016 [Alphaproteobacteria bacterium ADurb.Bin100]
MRGPRSDESPQAVLDEFQAEETSQIEPEEQAHARQHDQHQGQLAEIDRRGKAWHVRMGRDEGLILANLQGSCRTPGNCASQRRGRQKPAVATGARKSTRITVCAACAVSLFPFKGLETR